MRKIIGLFILVAIIFVAIPAGWLMWRPRLKSNVDLGELNKRLALARNHFSENGSTRPKIWLDNTEWEFRIPASPPVKLEVPSSWNSIPGLENYEGRASYSYDIYPLPLSGPRHFLCFRGVSYQARVFLNQKLIGTHEGAYTPFEFEISNTQASQALQVEIDNRLSMSTVPGKFEGWKHIGGIYREVYIEERPEIFLKDARIQSEPAGQGGRIKIEVSLDNARTKSGEYVLMAALAGTPEPFELKKNLTIAGEKNSTVILEGEVSGIQAWSPDQPKLYPLTLSLYASGTESPELKDRLDYSIGFRKIETRGNQIFLNGAPLKIKGISRHNFYPGYFQTIPPGVIKSDFQKIKDLGANTVRLGHYPNHPYALQVCDELGLLIWEEIPVWGKASPDLEAPAVIANAKSQLSEMILRDRNHASLVFVGVANEIASDSKTGEDFVKAMAEAARPLLGNQLLAAASFSYEKDRTAKHLDLIGFNCYWGWYSGKVSDASQRFKKLHEAFKNQPVVISEFGADAQASWHGASGDIYTEENQARFLSRTFDIIEKDASLSGGLIWLFADYPDPLRLLNPKPFYNQKGILTEDRKEKLAYRVMKSVYRGEPFTFRAKNRISGRVRDAALASIIMLVTLLGLFSPIPERWILIMPELGQPLRLIRRAIFVLAFQTLVCELIWRAWYGHQPLASMFTISYPAMKLLQVLLDSRWRPLFIFIFLAILWLTLGQFLALVSDPQKIRRHPLELALGMGDPFSWALPYPLLAFFPVLIAIALNLPSVIFSGGEFLNQFSTIPWIIFQISFSVLIVFSFFKLILVLRSGLGTGIGKACLIMAGYIVLMNALAILWGVLLVKI